MSAQTMSILALCISIAVAMGEYFYTKRFNRINLDAQYYDEIYKEFLMVELPKARMNLQRLSDGEIIGTNEMRKVLRSMRKKSICFKYYNEKFYKKMVDLLQKLEDQLVLIDEKVDLKEYIGFKLKVEKLMREIYNCIAKASHGRGIV